LLVEIFSLQKWREMTPRIWQTVAGFWHQRPCTIWHRSVLRVVFVNWSTMLRQLSYHCLGVRSRLLRAGPSPLPRRGTRTESFTKTRHKATSCVCEWTIWVLKKIRIFC
jgi:hypothetical protein